MRRSDYAVDKIRVLGLAWRSCVSKQRKDEDPYPLLSQVFNFAGDEDPNRWKHRINEGDGLIHRFPAQIFI